MPMDMNLLIENVIKIGFAVLIGGIIGAGVDITTGAAYDYPTLITVMAMRRCGAVT